MRSKETVQFLTGMTTEEAIKSLMGGYALLEQMFLMENMTKIEKGLVSKAFQLMIGDLEVVLDIYTAQHISPKEES